MSKKFKKFLLKTLLLTISIVLIFNVWDNLIWATIKENQEEIKTNNQNFENLENSPMWKTAVAITTNIWTRFKQFKETPVNIYKDIFSISDVVNNNNTLNNELIGQNMTIIQEYRNVLKTNIKQLINSSNDKPRLLNAFIEQLEFRYVLWSQNIKKLNDQKAVFESNMNSANTQVEALKQKIWSDFVNNNSKWSLENIDKYLELKKQYYYARTYIIYVNHFLTEYAYLTEYNKRLLDTLINNKEAIIKNAYIVIPDTWSEMLKQFDLMYSEEEFKN